jgi:predicted short-subunit dehydrogenase-like oxidoreductase (DUF2520 family)/integrase
MRLKREPDYWELRAYAGRDPITARPRNMSRSFRGGKRDAGKALTQFVAEIDLKGTQADLSVDGLLGSHIDHLEQRGREARTIEGYRSIARGVASNRVGRRQLKVVGPKDFDDFYDRLRSKGLSGATVQRQHALLGGAFQQAMKLGWASRNVVRLARLPAVAQQSRTVPTPELVAAIIRAAGESRKPENQMAFRLLAATGARRGEVCGLRWSSVDLDQRASWIRHAVARLASGELIQKDPKSRQARQVKIDSTTCQILRAHHEHQLSIAKLVRSKFSDDAGVIADLAADPTGGVPVRPDRLTQASKRLTARVPGAAEIRLHDLRPWYATTQLDADESLPAVAERIGDHVETLAEVGPRQTGAMADLDTTTDKVLRVRIIGAGRAGQSFAAALARSGVHVDLPHRDADLGDASTGTDLVLLCTPDDQLEQVAATIRPGSAVVGHCSGSRGLDVLAPHPRRCSIHPLMSLPDVTVGARRLLGDCRFAVAGDPVAQRLVEVLGGIGFVVADADRAVYHATACVASNHLVALCSEIATLSAGLGIDPTAFWRLMQTTLENVAEHGARSQLTGPVARGDWATVESHLAALADEHREPYLALAAVAARLAGHDLPSHLRT